MKPGKDKIWKALEKVESGLKFTQIKEITGLSAPALSNYLKEFQEDGLISLNEELKLYFIPEVSREREIPSLVELSQNDMFILNSKLSNAAIREKIREILLIIRVINRSKFDDRINKKEEFDLIDRTLESTKIMNRYLDDLILGYFIIQISELSKTHDDEMKIKREVYKGLVKGFKDVVLPYYDSILSLLTFDVKLVSENKDTLLEHIRKHGISSYNNN